jgi:cytochrome c oxidase cbb3-type subunit 3
MRALLFTILPTLLAAGCQREERDLRLDPPVADALGQIALMPNGIGGTPPEAYAALGKPYTSNAYSLGQGKRLYTWFNCKGCHADGGGASGPAFLDGWWQYGPDITSIFASIRDGRPNGMPAFRDRLTTEQIWQLAGYIQTIGAYSGPTAAPSRNDEMQSRPSENRAPAAGRTESPDRP